MHIGAQFLQTFFLCDTEMLFLIDDDKAEALERNALSEQRVCADDDIDFSAGEPFAGFFLAAGFFFAFFAGLSSSTIASADAAGPVAASAGHRCQASSLQTKTDSSSVHSSVWALL